MKHWGILIGGLILSFIFTAYAQSDIEQYFSSESKNIIYQGEAKEYTGSPFVFIEGISDKPRPKDWKDELKIRLFGSMEIPKKEAQKPLPPLEYSNIQNSIKINSLYKGEKEVNFVPHTSDWSFIIQILNDEDVIVEEDIQFIKTKEVDTPVRDWPKQNIELLKAKINGQNIALNIEEEADTLRLKFPELETGVHRIHLTYLIRKAGIFSKNTATLSLGLTDTGWNLNTDSFNGIVLFPVNIKKTNAKFLLGKNHQEIKEAFEVANDLSGAVFFRATHLTPANSAIQLDLDLQYDSFVKKGLFDKIKESDSFLVFLISLGIIFLYLILNVIEIKITPVEEILIRKNHHYSNNIFKNFLYRTGEIWIGLVLLWICTGSILYFIKTSFSGFEIQTLILIPSILILIIDYSLLSPRQKTIQRLKGLK